MMFGLVITNLRGGGAERQMAQLAGVLAQRGHECHLILLEHLIDHAPPPGVRLHALTEPGVACSKGWFGKRLLAWRLRQLADQLAARAPFDLVVSTLPYADEVARLARLPRLWHRIANTLSAEIALLAEASPRKAKRRRERYRRRYAHADLIAVSEGVAGDLRGLCAVEGRIRTIPNLYDAPAIRARAAEDDPDLPQEPYVIHVGRFAKQKRHDLLFRAFSELGPPHKLVLLTEPNSALTRLAEACGVADRVLVAGFRTNPYSWMRKAALLVLCSDHEGMPNVLVEALICGTPVVSTDCPSGPKEILAGPLSRYLVPCGDARALAAAMRQTLAHPPRIPEDVAERYAPQRVALAYEALAGS